MMEMTDNVLEEIRAERQRQIALWGEENHPMVYEGYDHEDRKRSLEIIRIKNKSSAKTGNENWHDILTEEFFEVFAETDPVKQREELVQVAAVAVAMIECLDRKMWAEVVAFGMTRKAIKEIADQIEDRDRELATCDDVDYGE